MKSLHAFLKEYPRSYKYGCFLDQDLNFTEWEPNRFLLLNFKNPPLYEVSHRDQVKKRTEFPNIKILALKMRSMK